MNTFIQKHAACVTGILNGFDRVRVRGTLRWLCYPDGLGKHLSKLGVLLKDFKGYMDSVSKRLRSRTQEVAEAAGCGIKHFRSAATSKEEEARKVMEQRGVREGRIAVFSAVEMGRTFELGWDPSCRHFQLRVAPRPCLHYYHYWMHPEWGFMHARVQTWFPFTVHLCLNGREWLARQMDRTGIAYLKRENCFLQIGDVERAQALMDEQLTASWGRMLDDLVPQFHPTYLELFPDCPSGYYWSAEETEWASDVMFRSAADLAALYPRLILHGMRHLGSREVMRFLNRNVPAQGGVNGHFKGEVSTDLRRRQEGVRIKHRLNRNSIKMYDKQGSVLRVETTIYDPRDLRVYRPKEGDSGGPKDWRIMRKAVADMYRRAEFCQRANDHYLESMATVESGVPLGTLVERSCHSTTWKGQRVRGLNPLGEDAALLEAVSRGEFHIQGFRNRDLRPLLCGEQPADPREVRRQSGMITRKLRLLRAHGLIHKVPKTHRYRLSPAGRVAITALLAARAADTAKLTGAA